MQSAFRRGVPVWAVALVAAGNLAAQAPPAACAVTPHRDSVRFAVFITDQQGEPWESLGRVTVAGRSMALQAQVQVLQRTVARGWYCSRVLPIGDYNIEIRSPGTFADTAIRADRSVRGTAVRRVTLRPDEWRVGDAEDYRLEPQLDFTYAEAPSDTRGRVVDSVLVRDSTVTVFGTAAFDIGNGLRASLLHHRGHLVLDIMLVRSDISLPVVLPVRFAAKISGLGMAPYRLTVRDQPFGAFNANRGYSAIVNVRNGQVRDAGYIGP